MTFTLAHLSDIHLAPLPPAHVLDLCSKRITGYLNWQRKRRFVHDRAVLDTVAAGLKAQAPDHIAVTGDIANIGLEAESPGFAERAWGDFMRGDGGEGFPYLKRRGPLAIIGLSTGVPTAPFQATGTLGAALLAALGPLLFRTRAETLFRVVLIHHP